MSRMKPSSASQVASQQPQQPAIIASPAQEKVSIYHWLVVILAAAGWLFDCMGQRIFVLSREPALRELLGAAATDKDRKSVV